MRQAYSVEQCRAADVAAQQTTSEATLIDRASTAVARRGSAMLGSVYGARVVILAGSGHNGADALWAGVKLQQRGAHVDIVVAAEPRDNHGSRPLQRLRSLGARTVPGTALASYDLAIDGLVGIGFSGELRWPELVTQLTSGPLVLAVDVPSGVDADTGAVGSATVRADVTVTFGGLKPGLLVDPGADYAGHVEVADIGLTGHLQDPSLFVLDADDVSRGLPTPPSESSKYTRGVVAIVAGSGRYTGAAMLCCGGALRAGAGMVRLYSSPEAVATVRSAWPEVVAMPYPEQAGRLDDDRVSAWVVGPGMGTDAAAAALLRSVLESTRPVLLDADAITLAAADHAMLRRAAPTIITPHLGEFMRLTGETAEAVQADRLLAVRRAATTFGVTVLLKGTRTVIASPDGPAYVNPTGTPWLATAGTGDVLSGVIGTLLTSGLPADMAAAIGAWLHGLAGRLAADPDSQAAAPITAGDVLGRLSDAVRATR